MTHRKTNDLWKLKAYKIVASIFIVATISISSFLVYYILNPPTLTLTFQFSDFYIQDVDTLEKNNSYYIYQAQIEGIHFTKSDWNKYREMNLTDFVSQPLVNPIFLEENIWTTIVENDSIQIDNRTFQINHTPPVVIADFILTFYNDDKTEFKSEIYFSLVFAMHENPTMTFSEYPYKSENSKDSISIKFLGASFNYTSNCFIDLFIEFNGIPTTIPSL